MVQNTGGTSTSKTRKLRKQVPLRINLDVLKEDEKLIQEVCKMWKKGRAMTTNVRKAILLFWDLEQGGVDMLLQLFPHAYDAIKARVIERELAVYEQRFKELQTRTTVPSPAVLEVLHRQSQDIELLRQWATNVEQLLADQKLLSPGGQGNA